MTSEGVIQKIRECLPEEDGFEVYPFRISAYNSVVSPVFALPYPNDSLALLIISTPKMFDVSFRRWITEETKKAGSFDELKELKSSPISEFIDARLEEVMSDTEMDIIHDHSMTAHRRPKVLMNTCGHIAGAAYYYQLRDGQMDEDGEEWNPPPANDNLKFIGLSLHPRFGGHFAFRSVLAFPSVLLDPLFEWKKAVGVLKTIEEKRDALEKFNYAWRDSRFRDFGNPVEKYSKTQLDYFGKPPSERWEVIRYWVEDDCSHRVYIG